MSDRKKALLLMGLSTASMCVMQFVVKLTNGVFPLWEQVFVRNFVTLIIGVIMAARMGAPLLGHAGVVLARAAMYISALMTVWSGIDYIVRNFDCIRDM